MIRSSRIRLVGLAAAAIAAAACSSSPPAAIDGPTYTATTTSTTLVPTTTGTPTTPVAPDRATVDLAPVTIDSIAVTSVAPADWIEGPPGVFTAENGERLAFGALKSWTVPNPDAFGLEPEDRIQIGGRWWDIYGGGTDERVAVVAVTGDELVKYTVELDVPAGTADHHIETVARPALEAFEVIDPNLNAGVLEAASAAIDGRSVAYATGGSGDATVVFESGWGDGMTAWALVGDDAAGIARVFAYDRAGNGHSEPSPDPRDGARIVEELRTILDATGHEPPYVLVGHSLGGLYMELFARTHPDEVAGVVLVDASTVGQDQRCLEEIGAAECDPFTDDDLVDLPEPMRAEGVGMAITEDQVLGAPPIESIPTVVLVASQADEGSAYAEMWVQLQRERAAELGATIVLAEGSTHYVQYDRPDLVLQAIEDVIDQHRRRAAP